MRYLPALCMGAQLSSGFTVVRFFTSFADFKPPTAVTEAEKLKRIVSHRLWAQRARGKCL